MLPRTAASLGLYSISARISCGPSLWCLPRTLPTSVSSRPVAPPLWQTRSIVLDIMAKTKPGFYAVRAGKTPGVYGTWDACNEQVKSYPNASFKKFSTRPEAEAFAFPSGVARSSDTTSATKRPASPPTTTRPPAKRPRVPKQKAVYNHTAATVDPSEWDSVNHFWRTASGRIVVYTDGSSLGNGQRGAVAGLGVWWADNSPRNVSERVPGPTQTNNRGELLAIIRAIETAPDSATPLEIRTDSQYSIKCMTEWLPGWRQRGYSTANGMPVVNLDLIQHLATLLDLRRDSTSSLDRHSLPNKQYDSDSGSAAGESSESDGGGRDPADEGVGMVFDQGKWKVKKKKTVSGKAAAMKPEKRTGAVRFTHVKAHVGLHGNEMADELANAGALLSLPPHRPFGPDHAKLDDVPPPSQPPPSTSSASLASARPSAKAKPPSPTKPAPAPVDPAAPYGYTKTGRVRKKPTKSQRESGSETHDSSHSEAATDSSDEYGLDKTEDADFWQQAAAAAEATEAKGRKKD